MAAMNLIALYLYLLVSTVNALPIPTHHWGSLKGFAGDTKEVLCHLPVLQKYFCPRQGSSPVTITTPIGTAKGVQDSAGVTRFSVQYATASRWAHSSVAGSWKLPDGGSDPATLPKACAQPTGDPNSITEDCLSMILFVPPNLNPSSQVPTMMWIHGGSFIVGSATATGLDGSTLAVATNSIVAVMQYRLGALGFMSPDGSTNLAVEDTMNALKFLQKVLPAFGGSSSKITIAGQSSGATMVRALLAAPSADALFKGAIMQSDPMDFGFLSAAGQKNLQSHFNSLLSCSSTDTSCLNSMSLDDVINTSMYHFETAVSVEGMAGQFEPMRPVNDGTLINSPLDSTTTFPTVSKPVLVTTVKNEAGNAIYGNFSDPLTAAQFASINSDTFGQQRTTIIMGNSNYKVPTNTDGSAADARVQLEEVGTDYLWKCAGWTFARNYASHGGKAFVGMYTVGSQYPDNAGVDFCGEDGIVCHEDDIQIVFGTAPSPNSAQSSLISQMQKRYKSFLANGDPNADGLPAWTAAGSSDVHPINLGGTSTVPVGACDPSFWGQAIQYDYQVFNI